MIIVAVIELVVSLLILKWLIKKKTGEPYSKKIVTKFVLFGALAVVVAMGLSIIASIKKDTFFGLNPVLAGALTAFFTAALLEECIKYIFFRLALIKNTETKSWLDVIIAAVAVGLSFGIWENIVYAVGGSANFLRVLLPLHIMFQFFMGYFYGKARVTGDKKYDVLSLAVPLLVHTLYDMPIIALRVALGGGDVVTATDLETIKQLPYYGYIIPLFACMIAVALAMLVGLIVLAVKINSWSRNYEKQELLNKTTEENINEYVG